MVQYTRQHRHDDVVSLQAKQIKRFPTALVHKCVIKLLNAKGTNIHVSSVLTTLHSCGPSQLGVVERTPSKTLEPRLLLHILRFCIAPERVLYAFV